MIRKRNSEQSRGTAPLRIGVTVLTTTAYCGLARDWQNGWDVLYDVPASLTVFSFLAQLLVAAAVGHRTGEWWAHLVVTLVALGIVAVSTVYADRLMPGHVSGHMTMTVLVAIVQSTDRRVPRWLRMGYWVPVPIVAAMRVFVLHGRIETGLVSGVLVGGVLGGVASVVSRSIRDD